VSEEKRVAIVSGAGSGIGRAAALRLAAEGYRLVLIDIVGSALSTIQSDLPEPALLCAADVSSRAEMFRVVEQADRQFGRLDVLVNAAGILRRAGILDHRLEDWNDTLGTNLDGAFWLCQAFARRLLAAGRTGAIVNIASIEALYPLTNHVAYSASKGALMMLTKAMALDLAPHGIRVNAVGPGAIATNMNADLRADPVRSEELLAEIPMGRFGEPPEVAEVVAFLASDKSSYMTGAFILVDGGWAVH
jgi:NAD(P)-dependent dehydrogenase (short-subunit alcohol dehydrogenase family)